MAGSIGAVKPASAGESELCFIIERVKASIAELYYSNALLGLAEGRLKAWRVINSFRGGGKCWYFA